MTSIFVAIPCGSAKAYTGHFTSLLGLDRLCRSHGIPVHVQYENGISVVQHARNKLATMFMQSNYEYMLFLDDDVEFDPIHILQMIETKKQVIGAIYPYKHYDWTNIARAASSRNTETDLRMAGINYAFTNAPDKISLPIGQEPIEVEGIGTGCLLIHRSAFETLLRHIPSLHYKHNDQDFMRLFDVSIDQGRLLTEDYWFCEKWRACGGKVYAATWARCVHWGIHRYGA